MPHPRKREPGQRALAWQTSLGKTWMSLRRRDEAITSPGREVKRFADCGVSGAGRDYPLPIRYIFVPHTGQAPCVAGRPFFKVTC